MTDVSRTVLSLSRSIPYLALGATSLFWSGNWVLARAMRADIPPFALNFWRWTLASLILVVFTGPELMAARKHIARHWRVLVLLSATGVAGFHATVYYALSKTPAINALLITTAVPIAIVIASWAITRDRITQRQALGIAISAAGTLIVVAQGDLSALAQLTFNEGDLWMLLALPLWAIYSVALRWRPTELSPLALVATLSIIGVGLTLPLYLAEIYRTGPFELDWRSAGTIIYVAVFASVLAYVFWNRGVAEVGANRAGLFVHLMPVFGIVLAVIFLGEQPEMYHALGMLLVFGGIFVSSRQN